MTRLLIALILSLTSLTANAAGPMSTSKTFDLRHKTLDRIIQSNSSLEISGTFKVWFLLGEPVVNCTASWNNPGISQVVLDSGTRVLAEPGEEDLWKLMLMAQFPNMSKDARRLQNGGGAHLSVFCDAGVVAQNGRNGFNVAGSPSWDKFICATPNKIDTNYTFDVERREDDLCTSVGGEWLPSAAAKQVALAGIKIEGVMVHSFELSNGDTLRRAEKFLWRMKSYEHKSAKAASIMERIRATGDRGTYVANDLWRRFYGAKERDSRLSAEGLRKMDDYIEAAYAELEALQTGARAEVAASWEARDKALVADQLERVAKVDTAIKQRDAEVDAYVAALDERAKNAPKAPVNPTAQYVVDKPTLTDFQRVANSRYGLQDASGRVVVEARYRNVLPPSLVTLPNGERKYYDFYMLEGYQNEFPPEIPVGFMGTTQSTTWLVNGKGEKVTPRTSAKYYSFRLFAETGGIVVGINRHDANMQVLYSIPEQKLIFNPATDKPTAAQMNTSEIRLRHKHSGRAVTLPRHDVREARARHALLDGQPYYYLTRDLAAHYADYTGECRAKTEDGEVDGIYPYIMFDINARRLLNANEFVCVPK